MNNSELFDKQGYLFVPNLITDIEKYFSDPPRDENGKRITGQMSYIRKDKVNFVPEEQQVNGALARSNVPQYKNLYYLIKKEVEKRLSMDLLPTYFYDRFYYVGQELTIHTDRPACEVSVTLQVSSNSNTPWPIWFKRPDGSDVSVEMKNGDGCIYKGCDIPHWRTSLASKYPKIRNLWRTIRGKEDDTYHHQIFFHYVNSQGPFVHYANDMIK